MLKNFIETIKYYIDVVLKHSNLDNGLIESKPSQTDYVHEEERFGFVSKKVLMPNCQWDDFRSEPERQNINFERMHCVNESGTNVINQIINYFIYLINNNRATDEQKEIVNVFRTFGFIKNNKCKVSARFSAITSGTTRRGNTLTKVANAFRHYGIVPEFMCPFDVPKNWNDYYNLNYKTDGEEALKRIGKKFLEYIEFQYEWVLPREFNKVKKYAPIQTSMYYRPPSSKNGIYQRTELRKNHAIVNDGFKINEYDLIANSYPPFNEKVSWDFILGTGMLYTIRLKKKIPDPLIEVLEKYDGESVKCKESNSIYHLQGGKKKAYTSELCFLAFNVNDKHITGYRLIDKKILDRIPQGEDMQIEKSYYWQFLKHIKGNENRLNELIKLIIK